MARGKVGRRVCYAHNLMEQGGREVVMRGAIVALAGLAAGVIVDERRA